MSPALGQILLSVNGLPLLPAPRRAPGLERIDLNVRDADATLWFGETTTSGAQVTVRACHRFGKPCMPIYPAASFEPSHVAAWIAENRIRTLNVAGNSEGEEPGIGDRVERFLGRVLQQLGHERT